MTRIMFTVCLLVLAIGGCCENSAFVAAVDTNWAKIRPEYVRYIDQDPTLNDRTKAIRKRTAEMFSALIEQAKVGPIAEEE